MFKRIKNINIKAKIFQIIKKIQDLNLIGLLKIQFDKFIVISRDYFMERFDSLDNGEAIADHANASESELTPKINKPNLMFFMIIAITILFIIWGSLAKIDRSIIAMGEIKPSSKIQDIQSLFTGKLEKIYVEEGDYVLKDEPLFAIDSLEIIAEKNQTENTYYTHLAKISRLRRELGITDGFNFPDELIENRPELIALEEQIFLSNMSYLEILERQVEMTQELYDQGAESEMSLLARKSALLERRNVTLNELTKAEEILANTLSKLPAQRIRAEQAIIKSTSDGTITNINFYTIGAVVEAGMKLAEIVPDDDDLVVEARVLPQDVSFIQDGMKAYISLTSYDESIYGRAKGEVLKVSANTRSDQDGTTFYIATLSADFEEFSSKVNGIIQPGMQTQISIIGDKRTVLGYLFSPVTKLTSKAFREK